jgi:hypothetical protein
MRWIAAALALLLPPQEPAFPFLAGAATANITPPLGEPIVGGFNPEPSTHVHDELHARCLVLHDGKTRLAIVVCDNVGIPREVFDEAKRTVEKETGLPVENMLMSATHTHSATPARGDNVAAPGTGLPDYSRFLVRRIADGVRRALHNVEPARIGWGVARAPEHVFNRRYFMKPGTPLPNPLGGEDKVKMNPGAGNPNVEKPAGPTDPEVWFVSVQSKSGRPIALLANYSLHYVGGVGPGHISADYFAVFADRMQQLLGADRQDPPFVGIMTNGTSGDVNNIDVLGPKPERLPPYEKMRRVAHSVADKVFAAHRSVEHREAAALSVRQRELTLKTRRPTPEALARAKEVLARPKDAKPAHPLEGHYARRAIQMSEGPEEVRVILQAIRVGDLGIAAIPFEVFTDTGLDIKKRSPFKATFTVSLANGSYGYLPTAEHHKLGGYETWLGTNRVEVDAASKIAQGILDLLEEQK